MTAISVRLAVWFPQRNVADKRYTDSYSTPAVAYSQSTKTHEITGVARGGLGGSTPPLKNVKKISEDKIVENTQS